VSRCAQLRYPGTPIRFNAQGCVVRPIGSAIYPSSVSGRRARSDETMNERLLCNSVVRCEVLWAAVAPARSKRKHWFSTSGKRRVFAPAILLRAARDDRNASQAAVVPIRRLSARRPKATIDLRRRRHNDWHRPRVNWCDHSIRFCCQETEKLMLALDGALYGARRPR
jgi:hypothetical protein